jgi:predicted Fe-Mo cluster-binding NifX family protein
MKKILIPVFNHRVSSRLDCTECFQLLEIDKNSIRNSEKIKIISKNQMEKLKSILEMKPDTVICNGLTDYCENEFRKNNIEVIPWVHGKFEDVVEDFLNGTLSSKKSV